MMTGKPSALRYRNDDTNTVGELIGDLGNMYRMNNRSALLRLVKEIDFFYLKPAFFFFLEYGVFVFLCPTFLLLS